MKRTLTCMIAAISLIAPLASADTYTWIGGTGTSWDTAANWTGGAVGTTPDDATDTAIFDTSGSQTFTLNGKGIDSNVEFSGNGEVIFTGITKGNELFTATGSVDVTVNSTNNAFYPEGEIIWNSSGRFSVDSATTSYMYNNTNGGSIKQYQGTIATKGINFRRSNTHYYLYGGAFNTTELFTEFTAASSNSVEVIGGILTNTGDMSIDHASVNIDSGTFKIVTDGVDSGTITSFGDGTINFLSTGTGEFVSEHTVIEVGTMISDGDITIDGASADAGDFFITNDGSNTTVSLVPEPATMSLLALGGMAMLRRRKK